jgi:hypothetical protein
VHEGLEIIYAGSDHIDVVTPLALFEDVLEEKEFEAVEEELLGEGAEEALDEESEEEVVRFLTEGVVGQDSHPVDDQSYLVVELVFLVLQTLLRVPLGVCHHLFLLRRFLLEGALLLETGEQVADAGGAAEIPGAVGGVAGHEEAEGDLSEDVGVVGDEDEVLALIGVVVVRLVHFGVCAHL